MGQWVSWAGFHSPGLLAAVSLPTLLPAHIMHTHPNPNNTLPTRYYPPPQGSPTSADRSPETFRHALAVTTVRPGMDGSPYLYTLNLSCPEVSCSRRESITAVACGKRL